MKLDIGSGYRPMKGKDWETLDVRPEVNPDIVADAYDIPRDDGYYDYVRAISLLEHFNRDYALIYLKEWHRVLKEGSTFEISVPDMRLVGKSIFESKDSKEVLRVMLLIYGYQNYERNFHEWGYTEETLRRTLESVGFKNVKRIKSELYAEELRMKATK